MIKRLALAVLGWLLIGSLALAAGTVNTTLSTTAYTDLGAAPAQLQALGGNIRLVVADSLPDPTVVGVFLTQTLLPVVIEPADAGSHVYALALAAGATVVTAPVYIAP